MKLACNWSPALGELLDDGLIKLNYVKLGAFDNYMELIPRIKMHNDLLLHGLGYNESSGMKTMASVDFSWISKLISLCHSPHLGIHCAICNADMYVGMTMDDIYNRMLRNIARFKDGISVPLLLENSPDCPIDRTMFDHHPFVDGNWISRVIEDTDSQLLLDITHAKITALYRNWNTYDYLWSLPLSRVAEVHINGSGRDEQGAPVDDHSPMKDEDFALLEWVLQHANPSIVTLEYGWQMISEDRVTDKELLLENLMRLRKMIVKH